MDAVDSLGVKKVTKTFVAKVGVIEVEADTLWDLGHITASMNGAVAVWVRGVRSPLSKADLLLAAKGPEPLRAKVLEQVFLVRGCPMPAKKTTCGGKFSEEQKAYHAYKDSIKAQCLRQGFDVHCDVFSIDCEFFHPLPADAFKKDGGYTPKGLRLIGQPKRTKPDADNLCKPIADALCPGNDQGVWQMVGRKFWGADALGCVIVKVKSYCFL